MNCLQIPGISLDDLLRRLGNKERQVYALASTTEAGWQTTLAWKPVATFKPGSSNDIARQLEAFSVEQQQAGRLVIGYLSYDFGAGLHGVPLNGADDLAMPLVLATAFNNWLTFDSAGVTIEASDPSFIEAVQAILKRPARPPAAEVFQKAPVPIEPRAWYRTAYDKLQAYIKAGDVYQLNLTHRLEGSTEVRGRDLFCRLHEDSQADFQAYIEHDDFEILSYSPERFISVNDGLITTKPIKGTRPRGATPTEDLARREDLANSYKERAELNMITDLMRNDLGKICRVGSVRVAQERQITAHPTLWHTNSTIEGRLPAGLTPIGALISLSPGGSITGCPKKRAIEIIDELEPKRRGLYTGSIFSISPGGELDSNIAIRTLIKKGGKVYLSVGGGIVYDSDEASEYQESLDKAASLGGGKSSSGKDI